MLAEEARHPAVAGQAQDLDPLTGMEAQARQMAENFPRPGGGVFCNEGLQGGERGAGHTNSIPNKNRTSKELTPFAVDGPCLKTKKPRPIRPGLFANYLELLH